MHSNVTIKTVSWPHFSWATLYSAIKFEDSEALAIDLQVIHIHTGFIELWLLARLHEFGSCHNTPMSQTTDRQTMTENIL